MLYNTRKLKFNKAVSFDAYPNGNSVQYKKKYSLTDATTIIRGTLRYEGYAFVMRSLCILGMFEKEPIGNYIKTQKTTWPRLLIKLI